MALTGMQIYKSLPKTNCKDCGLPTCMAFAMQVAAKQRALTDCPHVSEEGKAALSDASAPPIRLIKIGANGKSFPFRSALTGNTRPSPTNAGKRVERLWIFRGTDSCGWLRCSISPRTRRRRGRITHNFVNPLSRMGLK